MTIDELCEAVMRLRPNNFMALNGAAAGIIGSNDSGSDAIAQLQQATLRFAQALKSDDMEQLEVAEKDVIGKVMVAITMDALTEQKADEIAETVVAISQGRKGKN